MNFQVELSDEQAWAMAQWLKRAGLSEWRALAVDDEQARQMQDAGEELRQELAFQGYAPR
jgi:hypothetical protein